VIVRTNDGRLIGSNTDGLGGVRALTDASSGAAAISSLANARAVLIGAGGAAQALAFYLWEQMTDGELLIANRTAASAEGLVKRLSEMRAGRVSAIAEEAVAERVAWTDLVINASVKGQAGIRKLADGRWTCLEPYSALASAQPSALVPDDSGDQAEFLQRWYRASLPDIQRNHQASLQVCAKLPNSAVCYDIIYAPLETPFLRHARWSGHRTVNGRAMNLLQAVEAFDSYVCREWLEQTGRRSPQTRSRIMQAMSQEWGK
jgi:shikimate 5-dehydrogenase